MRNYVPRRPEMNMDSVVTPEIRAKRAMMLQQAQDSNMDKKSQAAYDSSSNMKKGGVIKQRKFAEGGSMSAGEYSGDTPKAKSTFKSAFASARSAGNKTFEWNGKKYTTALASATNPTAGNAKNSAEQEAADAIDPGDKRTREISNTRGSRPANYSRNTQTGATAKMLKDDTKKPMSKEDYMQSREQYKQSQDDSEPSTFKRGGVAKYARGGGIEQRGKTRGKIC
jgi:hypothetical protein